MPRNPNPSSVERIVAQTAERKPRKSRPPAVVTPVAAPLLAVKSTANETVAAMRLRYDQGDVTMQEVATLFSRSLKTTKRALHREKGASEYSIPLWLIRKAEKAAQAKTQTTAE
jgi:hypothetical protein